MIQIGIAFYALHPASMAILVISFTLWEYQTFLLGDDHDKFNSGTMSGPRSPPRDWPIKAALTEMDA
jgi:hypothetical protein